MRRLIQTEIEENLAMMIIEEKLLPNSYILVDLENEKIVLKVENNQQIEKLALPPSNFTTTNC